MTPDEATNPAQVLHDGRELFPLPEIAKPGRSSALPGVIAVRPPQR